MKAIALVCKTVGDRYCFGLGFLSPYESNVTHCDAFVKYRDALFSLYSKENYNQEEILQRITEG
jgi:hypothetical protein